ncbi:MAG: integrase arm-type DNA-binding domain-containing protein, partial [Hyphomicrobiales bacterium]|nr:integrase arm-type DNA-binding domain-containing protein [Hyphomicrobiales bacterium]
MKLTAKKVAKLLKQPGRYGAGRGLVLQVVSPTNASWLLRYQRLGRERWMGLGPAADFTLTEAKERARAARQMIRSGIDPIDAKRAAKAAEIAAKARAVTFGECATDYFRAHSPGWGHPKHVAQWRASVLGLTMSGKPATGDYCRVLRPLPVAQIDTPIVLRMLKPVWHDRPESASRVRARVAAVLDYAKAAGYRSGDNPASWDIIGKLLPSRSKLTAVSHFKAVPYAGIPAFVAELRKREGTAARCLEFLTYVASRSTEAREATWGEINFDEKLWRIPARRMKGGKEHVVPLAPEAIELLRGLPREGDGGDALVFIGAAPGKPLSDLALVRVMRGMGYSAVPHGLRSSFSDWSHEQTAHSNHAIELSLAHSIGAATEKAYRRGDMLMKRRKLMEAWARYCMSPPAAAQEPGKVVPMGRGRS